jgi:2-alkyl-3-oxoalkanoate reductase
VLVPRVVLLTGSAGALLEAIEADLAATGFAPRHVPLELNGPPRLAPEDRGAEAVVHVGLRTPRDLDEPARTAAEVAAAAAAAGLARATGAGRYVHVSTTGVYGRPRNLPCREGELKQPRTAYERTRWRAEQASWVAFRAGVPLVVLRPTLFYGPTLRGGPVGTLALVELFNQRRRRVPIIRRGPVAHLVHLQDIARAATHVVRHPHDRDVVGRAFNVGDEAPLPLAEHLAAALSALGYEPGRILPDLPRLTGFLLWLFRHVPDRVLLDPVNRRLARGWRALAAQAGAGTPLLPRIDRDALHLMSADHYYDTSRLAALGWTALHPVSTSSLPETIRALVARHVLPGTGTLALPAW